MIDHSEESHSCCHPLLKQGRGNCHRWEQLGSQLWRLEVGQVSSEQTLCRNFCFCWHRVTAARVQKSMGGAAKQRNVFKILIQFTDPLLCCVQSSYKMSVWSQISRKYPNWNAKRRERFFKTSKICKVLSVSQLASLKEKRRGKEKNSRDKRNFPRLMEVINV